MKKLKVYFILFILIGLQGCLMYYPEKKYSIDESYNKEIENENIKILDSNGNELTNGDSVIVIKDLPVKGSSKPIKSGTKIENIRLTDGNDGHNINCKIEGFGSMFLKSEFVKKA